MKKRILTGDRPTGNLHIGHYFGSIKNRVKLQDDYESYFIIADLHTLTTSNSKQEIEGIADNARQMVLDYLACGFDPQKATVYLQSAISEVYELNLLFEMLVTVPRLQRIPSLKDMAKSKGMEEMPFGLLGYPVLQSADILCVNADLVPVGKDNVAHIEITREIARRFNYQYGEVFHIPEALVSDVPSLIGLDGQAKMSKSLNNCIYLSDTPEIIKKKVRSMFTDPNRVSADVPGQVEGNPVFIYHDIFSNDPAELEDLKTRYLTGKVGDVEVKDKLITHVNRFLEPILERRAFFEKDNGLVDEIIYAGTLKMREETRKIILDVRKAMGLSGIWNKISRKAENYRKKGV